MKALALALAVLVIPAAADAATKKGHRSHHMSQQARGSYAYQPQIACTQYGCIPVPRGCYSEGGRTWGDMPSGFDVVTCPGAGTMYGNR
jgi:hypothetical protein